MLFIIEIILTVFAWRNGWKWWALLPVGIAVLIGIVVGLSVGISGGSSISPGIVVVDILAIIALVVLVAKKPTSTTEIDSKPKV